MKKFEMVVNNDGMRKEMKMFVDNLINDMNKYCSDKDYVVTDKARKYLNQEAKRLLKLIASEDIVFLELTTEVQRLFDKFENFSEENQRMLQLVSIINDTCLYNMEESAHELLLECILEQCQMRILTDMPYQVYLISKVKKIKEMQA